MQKLCVAYIKELVGDIIIKILEDLYICISAPYHTLYNNIV